MKILLVPVWLICSFFAWGLTLGDFTDKFPDQNNVAPAVFMGIMGPFGLVTSGLVGIGMGRHWLLVPKTKEERWLIFHQMYPSLTREYFNND